MKRLLIAFLSAGVLGACGGGGGGGGGGNNNACSVTGVAVAANPGLVPTGQMSTLTATVSSTGSCAGGVTWSATPAGGTLTPSGTTATFSSATAATYTVSAKSNDDAGKSGSATVTVTQAVQCPAGPNGTVVTHSSNISASETWAGDGTRHSVPNNIQINAPATVTVQPCAIVALGQNASITVAGDVAGNRTATLVAAGTDDTTGFVAFVRADSAKPWGILRGFNEKAFIDLHHTLVQGGGSFGGQYKNAGIALAAPGAALPVGVLRVDHVAIVEPLGAGIYFDSYAAFTADSNTLTVAGAADHPLMLSMMAVGSIPTFTGQNNAHDDALVIGSNANIFANMTIHKRLPIRIRTASMVIGGLINDTTPVTLTIDPGVVLRFDPLTLEPGAMVVFGGNGKEPNNKVGVLIAQGTANEPILFTSGAAAPAAGDWKGLWLDTAPGSRLDHVIIEYAGGTNGISSANCGPIGQTGQSDEAALIVGDFSTQYVPPSNLITNSTIRFSAGHAIDAIWWASGFAPDLTIAANGNTFSNIAGCNQTLNTLIPPAVCPRHGCQP